MAILAHYGPSAFAVYWVLSAHMDRTTRRSRPSQPTICTEANVSESTCKRALHDLETGDYIERMVGRGRGNHSEYLVKGFTQNPLTDGKGFTEKGSQQDEKGSEGTVLEAKRVHDEPEKGSRQDLKGFTPTPSLTLNEQESEQEVEPEYRGTPPQKPIGCAAPKRPTRLPEDWTLPDEWARHPETLKALAKRPWLDLSVEETLFGNYWTSKAKDATKLDWFKTWINWLYKSERPNGWRPQQQSMNGHRTQTLEETALAIQRELDEREAQQCR